MRIGKIARIFVVMAGVALGTGILVSPVAAAPPTRKTAPAVDPEVKLGDEEAAAYDKTAKFVTDPAVVDRVQRIGDEIAAVANEYPVPALWGSSVVKKFHYTFKVVDSKDVNAFSMPGGHIYVDKGLLDFIHSDDELAGVLGHEITHAAHHHVITLMREQGKITNILGPVELAALAAMILGKGQNDRESGLTALQASQLYDVAKMNGYSVQAEKDADHGAILLLMHTHFNPVGLYSFMLRLRAYMGSQDARNWGIYRDHPPTPERVAACKQELESLGIPIRLSEVDPAWRAVAAPDPAAPDKLDQISLQGILLCRVVAAGGQTAAQRGQTLAGDLSHLFDDQLAPYEVRVDAADHCVTARGLPIQTEADAAAQSTTLEALARQIGDAVMRVNQRQRIALQM